MIQGQCDTMSYARSKGKFPQQGPRNAISSSNAIAITMQIRHDLVSIKPNKAKHVIIKPTLHHVNLKTTRLKEMIDWYGMVLGTTVNLQSNYIAFISNDRTHHRIALLAVPGLRDDPDASAESMRTSEAFCQNPTGGFLNPNHVLAAYKAGATFEQLQKDTYAGIYPPSKTPNLHQPSVG
jgi:hypothetical protein